MGHFFYSLITFIIALFFTMVGVVAVMIPWSTPVRDSLVQFILEDALAISLFGFAFIVIGLAIASYILIGTKRRYYHIKSKGGATVVDEAVIQQYLDTYWKQLFPKHEIPCRLTLKNNKIHVSVDFPYLPAADQRPLLERVKNDLNKTFTKILGYQEEFYLSASFEPAPK